MPKLELEITGMTCESCAAHVEHALRQAGAEEASVDWRRGKAVVSRGELDERVVDSALAGTSYRVERVTRIAARTAPDGDGRGYDYDLIVLGSGGGAFAGAIRARDLGKRVLMVDRGVIGGTCVNVGCIPSKALLVRSERARLAGAPSLVEALRTKGELVARLRQAKYVELLAEYGIEFRSGEARLVDPHTVAIEGKPVRAEAI